MKRLVELHKDLSELSAINQNWPSAECYDKISEVMYKMAERMDILKKQYSEFFNDNIAAKIDEVTAPLVGKVWSPHTRQIIRNGIYNLVYLAAASGDYKIQVEDIDDIYYMIIVDIVINDEGLL